MISADDVGRALAAAHLTELLTHVDALTRPAIRLGIQAATTADVALGTSRIGGQPDLPPGTPWPEKAGVPMSFTCQIRLEEAHAYDVANLLPPIGLLSFFYDAAQETYGADPADRDGFRVYMFSGNLANLQRQPFPDALPAGARFQSCAVTFSSELTIAQSPPLEIPGLAWSPQQQTTYEAAVAGLPGQQPSGPRSQLLGFPNTLQDDMRIECQLASHGVGVDNADSDPRTGGLSSGAGNWQLLLQLDSEPQAGMRWGDAGMLYYWIERDALHAGAFDRAWVVLQSD